MSRYAERGLRREPLIELAGRAYAVKITFKTTINGPASMTRAWEGNYMLPSFDSEAFALWLPYGSRAHLLFEDNMGLTLDVHFKYEKRRELKPANIQVDAHYKEDLPNVTLRPDGHASYQRVDDKQDNLSPYKINSLDFRRLHMICTPTQL